MRFRDLPVDKKVLLTNFMMIIVPVLLIIATILGLLAFIVSRTGSMAPSAILSYVDKDISNYQLQLLFDTVGEKTVQHSGALSDNGELMDICGKLEKKGFLISISGSADGQTYISPGASAAQIDREALKITGNSGIIQSGPYFFRSTAGMVYHMSVKTGNGNTAEILIVSSNLDYYNDEYLIMENIEDLIKTALIVVGITIIFIIILSGILLAKKLSKSILKPIGKLRSAAIEIRNGNLDAPVEFASQDEFGKVCEDFEEMRLRLREAVVTRQLYEDGRKQLIAGISHDLATPLTSIKGYAKGVLDGIADTPEKKEHYISMLYNAACRMEKLVDNLLLFTKLDMRQEPFYLKPVDIAEFLADYCEEIRLRLQQEGMNMEFLNQCGGKPVVQIDGMQFFRVLTNLTENSIKYKKNGEAGKIRLMLFKNERCDTVLRFEDNGIGINPKDAEKVFQSFYRCEPAEGQTVLGSGIGLAISKQIVESMGGRIWAEGSPENGFIVNIILPEKTG